VSLLGRPFIRNSFLFHFRGPRIQTTLHTCDRKSLGASLRQVNLSPRDTFLPLRSVSFTLHAHKRRLTARQYFKINPTASDDEVWLTFQASRICLVPPILPDRRENKSIVNCGLPVSWVITQSLWSQGSPGRGRWLRIVYRHSSLLWHSEKLIARLMKHSIEQRSHNEISDI